MHLNNIDRMPSKAPIVIFSYFSQNESQRANVIQRKSAAFPSIFSNGPFQDGLLLESKEKGVIYPIIHFAPFYGWSGVREELGLKKANMYGNEYTVEQGLYTELASVQADLFGSSYDDLFAAKMRSITPTWSTFYLVLGFKQIPTSPFREMMESNWKEWTGARYLYLNLPDEFGLVRLTLYKKNLLPNKEESILPRSSITDLDLFLYIMLAECVHVTPRHRIFIKDFVERMRADQMPPFVALYEEDTINGRASMDKKDLFEVTSLRRRRSLSDGSGSSSTFSSPFGTEVRSITSPLFSSPIPSFRTTLTFSTL